MTMKDTIEKKLRRAFKPVEIQVINESRHHQGHAGDDGSGESHFKVIVVSEQFTGQRRLQRQRLIYQALKEEMPKIHALSILALTQEERS